MLFLAFLVFWSVNCPLLSQTMTSRSTNNSRSAALSATPTTSSGSEDLTPAFSSAASPLADLGSTQMASSGLSQELRAAIQAAATEAALAAVRASLASASASATPGSASSVSCVPSSVAQDQLHATANGFFHLGAVCRLGQPTTKVCQHVYCLFSLLSRCRQLRSRP